MSPFQKNIANSIASCTSNLHQEHRLEALQVRTRYVRISSLSYQEVQAGLLVGPHDYKYRTDRQTDRPIERQTDNVCP